MANLPRSVKEKMLAELWPDLAAYEKGPQTKVSDKMNPFRGATPARPPTPQPLLLSRPANIDATPGGAPAGYAAADPDSAHRRLPCR